MEGKGTKMQMIQKYNFFAILLSINAMATPKEVDIETLRRQVEAAEARALEGEKYSNDRYQMQGDLEKFNIQASRQKEEYDAKLKQIRKNNKEHLRKLGEQA